MVTSNEDDERRPDREQHAKRMKMAKRRGFEFFRAIGSPTRIVAPMVDQSELAFRMLTRRHGAQLCYTPMFHSRLFAESAEYRAKMFAPQAEDRPLVVQFCGNDPATVLAAARHVEPHCDAVDLNLGCPQGIARKGHYGSFLMKDKDTVRAIVETLSQNLAIPVCVKIRIFPDRDETLAFCEMLQRAGCDLLTVHGRTKEMNKTAVRQVDWEIIREIKQRLDIPVIANGGIECYEDVAACLQATQADGVMSSEAILEDPSLFADPATRIRAQQDPCFYVALAKEYLQCVDEFPTGGDKPVRAHLFKILFQDLRVHTDLRSSLASARNREAMTAIVAELETRLKAAGTDADGVVPHHTPEWSWYRRHRRGQEKLAQRERERVAAEANAKAEAVAGAEADAAAEATPSAKVA